MPMSAPTTPRLATDAVIEDAGRIVLIKRAYPPFKGHWALPGGFVEVGETVEDACVREAMEETGLEVGIISLIGVYSDPKRDPRGHTASVVFLCRRIKGKPRGADDAKEARWFGFGRLPELAFDHGRIIEDFRRQVRGAQGSHPSESRRAHP